MCLSYQLILDVYLGSSLLQFYFQIQYRFRAGGTYFRKYVIENHKTMGRGQCAISVAWLKWKTTVMLSGMRTAVVCHGWCIRNSKKVVPPLPCHGTPVSRISTSEWSPELSVPLRQVQWSKAQCPVFKDKLKWDLCKDGHEFHVSTQLFNLTLRQDILQPLLQRILKRVIFPLYQ